MVSSIIDAYKTVWPGHMNIFINVNNPKKTLFYSNWILKRLLICSVMILSLKSWKQKVLVPNGSITIGCRISLGPPALCSLYYSLRLISTHPIGPAFLKRAWQVHYVIGWIGIYLRKAFGNKSSTRSLPFYKHSAPKPKMWNTMSRTPIFHDHVSAHKLLR